MNAEYQPRIFSDDEILEQRIRAACQEMVDSPDDGNALAAFRLMRTLIKGRSPEQILDMERRMGLKGN